MISAFQRHVSTFSGNGINAARSFTVCPSTAAAAQGRRQQQDRIEAAARLHLQAPALFSPSHHRSPSLSRTLRPLLLALCFTRPCLRMLGPAWAHRSAFATCAPFFPRCFAAGSDPLPGLQNPCVSKPPLWVRKRSQHSALGQDATAVAVP